MHNRRPVEGSRIHNPKSQKLRRTGLAIECESWPLLPDDGLAKVNVHPFWFLEPNGLYTIVRYCCFLPSHFPKHSTSGQNILKCPVFLLSSPQKKPLLSTLKAVAFDVESTHARFGHVSGQFQELKEAAESPAVEAFLSLMDRRDMICRNTFLYICSIFRIFSLGRDLAQHSFCRSWTTQKNLKEIWWVWIHCEGTTRRRICNDW